MATDLTTATSRPGTVLAFDVLARAEALKAGPPDNSPGDRRAGFTAPQHITDAVIEGLRAGRMHYVPVPGIPELCEPGAAFLGADRAAGPSGGLQLINDDGRERNDPA